MTARQVAIAGEFSFNTHFLNLAAIETFKGFLNRNYIILSKFSLNTFEYHPGD